MGSGSQPEQVETDGEDGEQAAWSWQWRIDLVAGEEERVVTVIDDGSGVSLQSIGKTSKRSWLGTSQGWLVVGWLGSEGLESDVRREGGRHVSGWSWASRSRFKSKNNFGYPPQC